MYKMKLDIQLFAATATITNARQSYSVESNNEVQRITFTVKRISGTTYWQDNKTLTFRLTYNNNDGTTSTLTQSIQFNFPSGSVGYSKSAYVDFTVPHKTDGTQSISYEASITTGTSAGTLHPTGSATLETIPRASSITVNDANIGSATNIVINKANSGFTTTLYYKASGQSNWTKIVDKTSNQVYGWTVPTSFYALIPNSKTISCQFYAETYSGSTLVGTSSTVTATFTATGSPVINSCLLESIDPTTVNLVGSNRMIRYVSTVRATVNASGQNSASISSIRVNGVTANSSGIATFPNATTWSYDVTVTDSRGYSTTGNYGITWTNYISLTLNATIVRNQPTDGNVKISYNGNYYNDSFRTSSDTYIANTLTVQYRSRIKNGTWGDWTNLSPTVSGNTYSQTTTISGYPYTNQYDFEIRAIDKVQTKPITGIVVSKGKPIFNWADELFNVNGDIYQNDVLLNNIYLPKSGGTISGNLTVNGTLILNSPSSIINMIYPVGSIYMSVNSTSPATFFGGTWVQLKDRFLLGAGDTYSNGATGGESTHTLTIDEMPSHKHGFNGRNNVNVSKSSNNYVVEYAEIDNQAYVTATGGNQPHNNMPPYLVVYMWKRTA